MRRVTTRVTVLLGMQKQLVDRVAWHGSRSTISFKLAYCVHPTDGHVLPCGTVPAVRTSLLVLLVPDGDGDRDRVAWHGSRSTCC